MADRGYGLTPSALRQVRWFVGVGVVGVLAVVASMLIIGDESRPPLGAYLVMVGLWCLTTVALVLRVHLAARKRSIANQ